jgi:hypothetical protein
MSSCQGEPKDFVVRRFGLIVALLILSMVEVHAGLRPEIGLKSGLAISSTYGDSWSSSLASHSGFTGGVFFPIPLNRDVVFQVEVLYSSRELRRTYSLAIFPGQANFSENDRVSYIEFPALLKFPFPSGHSLRTSLYLGGSVAIKLKAQAEGSYTMVGDQVIPNGSYAVPISNAKSSDFGPVVGVDASLAISKRCRLYGDIRYDYGLSKLFEDVDPGTITVGGNAPVADLTSGRALDLKHTGLSFNLGLSWR